MNAEALRKKRKGVEDRHSKPALVRLHRAISWLARSESETDDFDAQFVFLWISFNAAYAQELGPDLAERDKLAAFFAQLLRIDNDRRLQQVLFEKFSGPIRTLVENRFVFEPFWRALREHDSSGRWETQFSASKRAALKSIFDGETERVLSIVFDRLYVLRNQIVHGGATWNSGVNRAQMRDGATIMMSVVPILIDLMLDHPELEFGEINYPVV
ncbi:MAG: hypothetical protein ACT4QA_15930 [Panacagrimonas sp.]